MNYVAIVRIILFECFCQLQAPGNDVKSICAEFVDRLQALQRPVEANIINGGSPLAKIRKILQAIAIKQQHDLFANGLSRVATQL